MRGRYSDDHGNSADFEPADPVQHYQASDFRPSISSGSGHGGEPRHHVLLVCLVLQ
jgi:hypothetical protein